MINALGQYCEWVIGDVLSQIMAVFFEVRHLIEP